MSTKQSPRKAAQQRKLTANYKPRPDVVQAFRRADLIRAICSFGFAMARKGCA